MTGSETRREILNIAILVVNQTLFMVAAITVMTLSGVVGGRLSDTPSLATLPVALTMVGAVVSTLPASLFMKRVGRHDHAVARAGYVRALVLHRKSDRPVGALPGVDGRCRCAAAVERNGGLGGELCPLLGGPGVAGHRLELSVCRRQRDVGRHAHSESERGKVQGVNDLIVLSLVAIGSLLAGTLFHLWGWVVLNLTMVPLVIAVVVALCVWQIRSSAPAVST